MAVPTNRVYFPNFVFTLLRPVKRAPNEVAFKVNKILTKYDIKNFLEKAYGLKVLAVSTVNFLGRQKRIGRGYIIKPAWKKAIVTIDHEFIHPPPKK